MKKHKAPLRCRVHRYFLGENHSGISQCAIGAPLGDREKCEDCEMNWVRFLGEKMVEGLQDGIRRGKPIVPEEQRQEIQKELLEKSEEARKARCD